MTKQDFINNYCERSKISWDELKKTQVVLACNCGVDGCLGWAMVSNNPENIKNHNLFCNNDR